MFSVAVVASIVSISNFLSQVRLQIFLKTRPATPKLLFPKLLCTWNDCVVSAADRRTRQPLSDTKLTDRPIMSRKCRPRCLTWLWQVYQACDLVLCSSPDRKPIAPWRLYSAGVTLTHALPGCSDESETAVLTTTSEKMPRMTAV